MSLSLLFVASVVDSVAVVVALFFFVAVIVVIVVLVVALDVFALVSSGNRRTFEGSSFSFSS